MSSSKKGGQSNRPFFCAEPGTKKCKPCRMRVISGSFLITAAGLIVKGIIGSLVGSQALIADAVHSSADSLSFGINYATARKSSRKSRGIGLDQNVLIGCLVFLSGVWICCDNVTVLVAGVPTHPGLLGLVVAVVSVAVNYYLFATSKCLASKFDDQNVTICNIQNKANFLASCLTVLGVALSQLGLVFFDPLIACVIGCILMGSAWKILSSAFDKGKLATMLAKGIVSVSLFVFSLCIVGFFTMESLGRNDVVLVPAHGVTSSAPADSVLGRAQYFLIFDSSNKTVTPIINSGRNFHGDVSDNLTAIVKTKNVDVVLAQKIGSEMFNDLKDADVQMYYFEKPGTAFQVYSDYQQGRLDYAMDPNVERGYGRGKMRWLSPW